jgi:hypothetical protein
MGWACSQDKYCITRDSIIYKGDPELCRRLRLAGYVASMDTTYRGTFLFTQVIRDYVRGYDGLGM